MGLIIVVFLLLVLVSLQGRFWGENGALQELKNREEAVRLAKETKQIYENKNNHLRASVQALRVDMDTLESRARSELGMIKDDEIFYLWVD